jgi:hypothetical protein
LDLQCHIGWSKLENEPTCCKCENENLNFPRNPCFGFALLPAIAAALPLHSLSLSLSLSRARDLDLLPADLDSWILCLCYRAARSVQNATGVVNSLERTQTSSSFGFPFCFRLLEYAVLVVHCEPKSSRWSARDRWPRESSIWIWKWIIWRQFVLV